MIRGLLLALALCAGGAQAARAFTPDLPANAEQTAATSSTGAAYRLPVGPWTASDFARQMLEGARTDRAWRLPANSQSPTQILVQLRAQIAAAGYEILFECETDACGGFDFRYEAEFLPEPAMHVDLGDFRFLSAQKGQDYLALMVSRSSESGFVQLTEVSAGLMAPPAPTAPAPDDLTAAPVAVGGGDLTAELLAQGHVALDDLTFESGADTLGGAEFASLRDLAAFLHAAPQARVTLVGHTDLEGGLAGNVALSKRRAEAVRRRLIEAHGIAPAQIGAEGAGWLAPRASNLTPEGRMRNRRVEVILTAAPQAEAGAE